MGDALGDSPMRALRAWTDQLEPAVLDEEVKAARASLLSEEQRVSLAAVLSAGCLDAPIHITIGSVERIRRTVTVLRASEEGVESRLAELKAENGRLRRELEYAKCQIQVAETRISIESARADAAEQRCRDGEAKFIQMLNSLADELEARG
jgi:hypothetical protein